MTHWHEPLRFSLKRMKVSIFENNIIRSSSESSAFDFSRMCFNEIHYIIMTMVKMLQFPT